MHWKKLNLSLCLNLLGAVILLAGVSLATWIYVGAENREEAALGYEGGYPINPGDSKQYQRDMELYGGKANLLADEFRRGLAGWFQGKSLAVIVGGTSLLVSLGCFYGADRVRPPAPPDSGAGRFREEG